MNSKSELTFIIYSPFPYGSGGRETWLANIANILIDNNKIKIISRKSGKNTPIFKLNSKIELIEIPTPVNIPIIGRIFKRSYLRVLNALFFCIFVSVYLMIYEKNLVNKKFFAMGTLFEPIPFRLFKIKKIHYYSLVRGKHAIDAGNSYPMLKNWFKKLEIRNLSMAKKIISNGQDTGEYIASQNFQSTVVPNGVNFREFANERDYNENSDKMAFIATLSEIRGVRFAIEGFAEVITKGKTGKLTIVGKGNQEKWKKNVQENRINGSTVFLGELDGDGVRRTLNSNNIFLALVLEEYASGYSMSLLEAMAAGNAIIAWDNAIYRQILKNGYTGIMVPERDISALASAIENLLNNMELQKELGQNAREEAAKYDWPLVAENFMNTII